MDKRNNAYLYITCFIVSIGGLLLGISANVSGASMYFGDFFGLQSGSFQEGLAVSITMLATFIGNFLPEMSAKESDERNHSFWQHCSFASAHWAVHSVRRICSF